MNSVRMYIVAGILCTATAALLGFSVAAAQPNSQLHQIISPPVCNRPSDCPMTPPILSNSSITNGRPAFAGRYDPAFSKYLRVTFNGTTYVLGIDGELGVRGNRWYFDLSNLLDPLSPGSYALAITEEGYGPLREIKTIDAVVTISDSGGILSIIPDKTVTMTTVTTDGKTMMTSVDNGIGGDELSSRFPTSRLLDDNIITQDTKEPMPSKHILPATNQNIPILLAVIALLVSATTYLLLYGRRRRDSSK